MTSSPEKRWWQEEKRWLPAVGYLAVHVVLREVAYNFLTRAIKADVRVATAGSLLYSVATVVRNQLRRRAKRQAANLDLLP
jgi:uncharacterized membrane protein